jgi:hypothetical protein
MGSGFISRSDDVPDLMLMAEARPTEDGQPYLLTQLGLCLFPSANQMIHPLVGMTASSSQIPKSG